MGGMTALTLGLLLFSRISAHGTYLGGVLIPSLLVAIGIGTAFVPATIAAVSGVARAEAGLASGLVNTSRLVGGALGLAILAAIATARTNQDLRHAGVQAHAALTSGFQLAFVVAAGFALVGGVVAVAGLPRRIVAPQPADAAQAAGAPQAADALQAADAPQDRDAAAEPGAVPAVHAEA
jgi:MFS family permease